MSENERLEALKRLMMRTRQHRLLAARDMEAD